MSSQTIDFSKYEEKAPAIDFSQYETAPVPAPQSTMDKVGHGVKEFLEQVNPVSAVKGVAQLAAHPIDTYKADAAQRQDILKKGMDAYHKGNYTEAAAHMLYGMIPFAGPNLERSGEQFQQGDIAGGIGSSLGQGVAMAAPEAIKGANLKAALPEAVTSKASKMYQSALKPSTTLPPARVAAMVKTGLENQIPVSAPGLEKLGGLIDDLNTKIKAEIGSGKGKTIDPQAVAQRADAVKGRFATQVNPEADLQAIESSKSEFLRNNPQPIPAADAQSMKQGTYGQLKSKAYGELKSASIESQKALARGLKEELNTTFPELAGLNAKESQFINLQDVLEKAVQRNSNHQLVGIGTPIAAAGAKAVTGSSAVGAVSGLIKAIVDDPVVKSRIAIALNRKGIPLNAANARIAAYSAALGNAASAESPSDHTNEPPQ